MLCWWHACTEWLLTSCCTLSTYNTVAKYFIWKTDQLYVLFCLWWSHHACWLCFRNITLVHNRIFKRICKIRYLFTTKLYFIIVDICPSNFCYFSRKTSRNVLNFHIMASTSSNRHCYCCTAWLQYIWHATSRFSLLLSSTPVVPFSQ